MAQLCESDDIKCSLYEIEKGATNYTIETLKSLEKERPKDDFYFCIGADMLPDFHKWKDWEALKDTKKLVVYPRGDMKMSLTEEVLTYMKLNSLPSNIRVMDFQDVVKSNISSTIIRQKLQKNLSIRYLVTDKVEQYIISHELYKL